MRTKVRAGRYVVQTSHGAYVVKQLGDRKWVVLNDNARMVGRLFTTLGEGEAWVSALHYRPASVKSKNYLRQILTRMGDDLFAGKVRAKINEERLKGELPQSLVTLAIDHLMHPDKRPHVPAQSAMPRSEAIRVARAAVTASKS